LDESAWRHCMSFVVVGTDHRFQDHDPGFEGILKALLAQKYFEPMVAVAEEYPEEYKVSSIGQRLAEIHQLRWFSLDMTVLEKAAAGILKEQMNRPNMFEEGAACRVPSDEIREAAWVEKLEPGGPGSSLVICGYLHFEALVQKLRAKGHVVDKRVYLETVPKIELCIGSEMLKP